MKRLAFMLSFLVSALANAQVQTSVENKYLSGAITKESIAKLFISKNITIHFILSEEIKYVDISNNEVAGDLPEKNILRLKVKENASLKEKESFVVTIVTASMLASYMLTVNDTLTASYVITANPQQAIDLNDPAKTISEKDYYRLALRALGTKRSIRNINTKAYQTNFWVNNIFIAGDLIILDLGAKCKSNLSYTVNEVRFKVIDAKKNNAHVSQDIELQPLYRLYDSDRNNMFEKNWRNFYIFKKFTFPTQKILEIEMTEMQMSGRKIKLLINYNDILNADFLN